MEAVEEEDKAGQVEAVIGEVLALLEVIEEEVLIEVTQ